MDHNIMARCLNVYASSHPFAGAWDLFDGIVVGRLGLLMNSHPGTEQPFHAGALMQAGSGYGHWVLSVTLFFRECSGLIYYNVLVIPVGVGCN